MQHELERLQLQLHIKKKNADMVLFFKVGKFYELFEEDALLCHRELDLAFMGKGAPHVGFPEAALRKYCDKMVALGYKVGVVEQMETPQELKERNAALPKGVKKETAVRREICEVRTLGTNPESEKAQATYLLSVTEDQQQGLLGVCFVDAATGHFTLGQCADDEQKNCLRTLLSRLRPAEVVFDSRQGSRENIFCSNRGRCDHITGTCICYHGFASSDGQGGMGNRANSAMANNNMSTNAATRVYE